MTDARLERQVAFHDYLLRHHVPAAPSLLDIGAGAGHFTAEFARRHPRSLIIAVERQARLVASACGRFRAAGSRLAYGVVGDGRALPLMSQTISLVTMISALHWISPMERALSEAVRVMRADGTFVLSTLVRGGRDDDLASVVDRRISTAARAVGVEMHRSLRENLVTDDILLERLRAAGLEVMDSEKWETHSTYQSNSDFGDFIERTMGDFYWGDLPTTAAAALRSKVHEEIADSASQLTTSQRNVLVTCRPSVDDAKLVNSPHSTRRPTLG